MKRNVWITNPDKIRQFHGATTPEERFECVYLTDESLDMSTSGWILVGHADITVNYLLNEEIIPQATKTIDEEINKLRAKSRLAIGYLEGLKSDLLSLPFIGEIKDE